MQTPTGTARVTNLHLYHADTTTYDLTIGTLHTFYSVRDGITWIGGANPFADLP